MNNKKYYPGSAAFFPAGSDFYMIYNYNTKKLSCINKNEAFKYSQIKGIKTSRLHITDLLELKDPLWCIEKYEKLLSFLKKEELLRPLQLPEMNESKQEKGNYIIATITCNRFELLSHSLESIAEEVHKNHSDLPLAVFDDSTNKETEKKNRQFTLEVGSRYGLKTFYFGRNDKKSFVQNLGTETEKKGVDNKILNYTFFGNPELSVLKGGGGNRNTALLKFAGDKIISFDDDTLYQISAMEKQKTNIEISANKIPEINLYSKMEKIPKRFKQTDSDVIKYIKNILGESCNNIMIKTQKSGGEIFIENLNTAVLNSAGKTGSYAKTAMLGIYGGKWYSSPFSIYLNEGRERNKSFKKKSGYNKIKENPVSLILPQNLTLSRASFLIATALGIDTRDITPPFPPQQRADDGIWASIMLALNNNSFIAHLPFAIYHEMENKISFTKVNYEDTSAEAGLITVLIIEHIKRNLLSLFPEITYENLGNKLIELSRLDDKQFTYFCHDQWLEYTGGIIAQLENLLVKYREKPKHWAIDIENFIALLEKQSVNPVNSLPREFRNHYSINESIRLYKLFFKDYGELIKCWPVIWDAAVKVNKRGNLKF